MVGARLVGDSCQKHGIISKQRRHSVRIRSGLCYLA